MQTETVVRIRSAVELELQTLCPAEPITIGQPGQDLERPVLTGWRLYLPQDADVVPRDRMQVRDVSYSVLGQPAAWAGGGLVVDVADVAIAQCTIGHPGGTKGAFEPATGTYPTVPFAPHFTGDCEVWPLSPAEQRQLFAEDLLTELGYLIVVDLTASAEVRVGDVVTITTVDGNGDPLLVGATLQVRSFARGAMPGQRDLRCTLILPTD